METKKFCLTEKQMPTQWYNIVADMPNKPLPPLHPGTKKPVTKEQMSAIFAEELIDQEMSTERYLADDNALKTAFHGFDLLEAFDFEADVRQDFSDLFGRKIGRDITFEPVIRNIHIVKF